MSNLKPATCKTGPSITVRSRSHNEGFHRPRGTQLFSRITIISAAHEAAFIALDLQLACLSVWSQGVRSLGLAASRARLNVNAMVVLCRRSSSSEAWDSSHTTDLL